MYNINLPKYDDCRKYIRRLRDKEGSSWDSILFANKGNLTSLKRFIQDRIDEDFFPSDLNSDIWQELVNSEKSTEEKKLSLEKEGSKTSLISVNSDNDTHIPSSENSSWQLYKKKLIDSGWSKQSVSDIEEATINILKKLNSDTRESGPVKGLVVGNVQSGKTANMAGLMAMAADWGWNMFIVLSGTIENLRNQTQRRLWDDLNHPGLLTWVSLQHLSKRSPSGQMAQDLIFDSTAHHRYFTVCLKNKTRLENLISWINADKNKLKQMKILIIDDEGDQASINTLDIEKEDRAKINQLIVKLVEGNTKQKETPQSVNYISYTATPYSNFLNESAPESLYPKDFIGVLKTSNEYFGPKQLFGVQDTESNEGMDIIREVSKFDVEQIHDIQSQKGDSMPKSLQDSICWFLCATAAMRKIGYKKPISMLVHTSQRQNHHKEVAELIGNWMREQSKEEILNMCEQVYLSETNKFTLDDFREQYEEYSIPNEKINNYPLFNDIREEILQVINTISHIQLGEDGDLEYNTGIHLCIDNCANNGINEENMFLRLAYPDPRSENYPEVAPAFIIVGGSTLSRGLTIEGLVSTFFLRASTQADSLMQMGRWFGYRRGYELFPRIWMTKDTKEKFEFLATLEEELKDDLKRYSEVGASPSEVGPRIKNSPQVSWLRITSKSKMQGAQLVDLDFTGTSNQTTIFSDNPTILKENIKVTETFFDILGDYSISVNENAVVWRNISFDTIKRNFLLEFNFHPKSRVFNQIEAFCNWYESSLEDTGFNVWNVVVAGKGRVNNNTSGWKIDDHAIVGKVNRSRRGDMNPVDRSVSIGVLRGPMDLFADIEDKQFLNQIDSSDASSEKISEIRRKAGLELVPQLLIYLIDKDSKAVKKQNGHSVKRRKDLDFSEDIVGVSLYIPGKSIGKSFAKRLTVKINQENQMED